MPPIRVLVAAASPPDMIAQIICVAVRRRADMVLVEDRVLDPREVGPLLDEIPDEAPCALVLIGPFEHTAVATRHWLRKREQLVALRVAIKGDQVRITARDVGMESLLNALRELVEKGGSLPSERVSQVQLPPPVLVLETAAEPVAALPPPPGLRGAAIHWIQVLLRAAVGRLVGTPPGQEMVAVTSASIADFLESRDPQTRMITGDVEVAAADQALTDAFAAADADDEPLALAARSMGLDPLEFRMMVLALGPELDPRYQRWISLLMDDAGRRVGTLGLYAELLGVSSQVAESLAACGRLTRWRLFEGQPGAPPAADEPLRLDPPLRAWLLGAPDALAEDPSLRRILRTHPWPGAGLIVDGHDRDRGTELIRRLRSGPGPQWLVLAGDSPPAWRALIEAGGADFSPSPLRAELAGLVGLSRSEIEETGIRLARLARIAGSPLVLDSSAAEDGRELDLGLSAFLAAIDATSSPAAIVTTDPARIARLLGAADYEIIRQVPASAGRTGAFRSAAEAAGADFSQEAAESLANLYPLEIDGLEQAMRLARAKPLADGSAEARRSRFITACKEVAAEGESGLAQRIEPIFGLADVVLPPDRKGQLEEIVDNIRFAPKVLEGWKFRDQLPYGLGVTALFHGPSGTGKTMASMAVARALGVQILRIDLSRVVSKYIGDTEKNIDRVFLEAQRSGAALVIDEADGLLARRSEVKDAHDRYANLEVAYLLQRMEAYEGLAILTTNLRQNLDTAFLRRLRFIVEFPRPDAAAREEIWRRCLPEEAHELDDAAFRQLGRRIELTGGSIRQITLRAAFVAAAAGTKIGPEHVVHAARAEFAKLGVPPPELDLVERRRAA